MKLYTIVCRLELGLCRPLAKSVIEQEKIEFLDLLHFCLFLTAYGNECKDESTFYYQCATKSLMLIF